MKKRNENRAVQVIITINLIEKAQKLDRAIEKVTSPTEHSPASPVNVHIEGDYVQGDKVVGDIARRDILKAGDDITINQNQIGELKDIITEPRKVHGRPELPKEKKEELEAEIRTQSPKPITQIIKHALSSARKIIEPALGVVTAVASIIAKIVFG